MRATRGFLVVSGTMADEHVTIIVNHLPSRGATSFYREEGGRQLCVVKDSLVRDDPNVKLLIMGDRTTIRRTSRWRRHSVPSVR